MQAKSNALFSKSFQAHSIEQEPVHYNYFSIVHLFSTSLHKRSDKLLVFPSSYFVVLIKIFNVLLLLLESMIQLWVLPPKGHVNYLKSVKLKSAICIQLTQKCSTLWIKFMHIKLAQNRKPMHIFAHEWYLKSSILAKIGVLLLFWTKHSYGLIFSEKSKPYLGTRISYNHKKTP